MNEIHRGFEDRLAKVVATDVALNSTVKRRLDVLRMQTRESLLGALAFQENNVVT